MSKEMENADSKSLVMLFPIGTKENKYLEQVRNWLQDDSTLQIQEIGSIADVGKQIARFNQGLMIFSIRDKADLVEVVNCLATHQQLVKEHFLRVIGVTYMEHPEVIKLLMKRGVADILPTNLTAKALKHKISQSFKILERYHATHSQGIARESSSFEPEKKNVTTLRTKGTVQRTPQLTIQSDCWLLRKGSDVRQFQGRWLIDLLGPGPSVGIWEETSSSTPSAPEWVWNLRQAQPQFVSEEGAWVFKGRKPEFLWSENRWRFVGERAELVFVRGDEVVAYRIKFNAAQNVLEVPENSDQAKQKLPFMIESIEAELRFRNEKSKPNLAQQFALGEDAPDAVDDFAEERDEVPEAKEEEVTSTLGLRVWISEDLEGRDPIAISPIEMSDMELVAEVQGRLFSKSQKICVIADTGVKKHNSRSQFQATVFGLESCDASHDLLTIRLADGQPLPMDQAAEEICTRQDEIFNFLKSARGW